ncbi:ParB N-terminal domain-containing protein [Acinetobacter venetianus]|uniref:ParB N-terminal domain-containing protein n=1 Tax=Acinetobacter venetianus TaxID=52133 RepID=UPI00384BDAA1
MRFDNIVSFSIDDLLLDENNYRLTKCEDQDQALLKIYNDAPDNFINMMTSIAEDDLGEPLLVYKNEEGQHIVADGNRRSAALKALKNPKKTGVVRIINKAEQLNKSHQIKFDNISAQVSDDKELIFKTIYERHAAGKGKSRIGWAALGSARFRFEQSIDDGQEWYSVPLIFEVEASYPQHADFINSSKYSHETFRRVVNAAIKKGLIDKRLFNDASMQVNKTNNKRRWNKSVELSALFIESMKKGEISLSRGENYADKNTIERYLNQFESKYGPQNTTKEEQNADGNEQSTGVNGQSTGGNDQSTDANGQTSDGNEQSTSGNDQSTDANGQTSDGNGQSTGGNDQSADANGQTSDGNGQSTGGNDQSTGGNGQTTGGKAKKPKTYTKIPISEPIATKLALHDDFYKLSFIYYSICTISAEENSALISVGCWSFLDTLSTVLNKNDKDSFVGFFNNKINNDHLWKTHFKDYEKKDIKPALAYILEYGNSSKHSKKDFCLDASTLINKFRVLEGLIILALQTHLDQRTTS